ncbi:SGNH/GDSL hydrolase family protein [Streptomyces tsukubensis]|uniref:SGNH hydrolase n=1 Tax=Streptomyces tsukubensis TaxID=83656 RepID=A0A1V4A727_9ACTN|nr:SGNH/GDSL hydrolase family protein [Streptomyces tsukubensis]OON76953.1 SGNH hydrolase [Streptomyces tsukubensis]QFR93819.1 SGNH/GDSL hydrolase family protein [Streptomyces tsukubensis]
MTRRHGYVLLAAIAALVVLVSTAIYVGVGRTDNESQDTLSASPRASHNPRNSAEPASAGSWVGSWAASPAGAEPGTETGGFAGRSIRNVVHTSLGGTAARITLSNLYGQQPLSITHASIAVAAAPSNPTAAGGTLRRLTFGGISSVTIPPGEQTVSDAVRLQVPHDADLLVTTYSPIPSGSVTYHPLSRQISYVADGDRTEDLSGGAYTEQTPYWRYLSAVDVLSNESDGTVAVVGDSLTDGITSTMGANHRWTDFLAARLRTETGAPRYGVVNEGISGNRILLAGRGRPADNPSALSRFQRDALSRTGVKAVVIDLGINDILRPPQQTSSVAITEGLRKLTEAAHARGLRVVGATLMPFAGHRGYTPRLDAVRRAVNAQIRAGKVFDSYVDFDRALRDPYASSRLRPSYDSGDHLHPSDAGYRRMAQTFNLSDLKGSAPANL